MSASNSRFAIPAEWKGKEDRVHFPYQTFDLGGHETYASCPGLISAPFPWSVHEDKAGAGWGARYKPVFDDLRNQGLPFDPYDSKSWHPIEEVTERWLRDVVIIDKLSAGKYPEQKTATTPLFKPAIPFPPTPKQLRLHLEGATPLAGDIDPVPTPEKNPELVKEGIYISGSWIEEFLAPYFYTLTKQQRAALRETRRADPAKWVRDILAEVGDTWDIFQYHVCHVHNISRWRTGHKCPNGDVQTCLKQGFWTGWWGFDNYLLALEKLPKTKEEWRKEMREEIRAEVLAELEAEAEGKVVEKTEEKAKVETMVETKPTPPRPKPERKPTNLVAVLVDEKKGEMKWTVEEVSYPPPKEPVIWRQDVPGYKGKDKPSDPPKAADAVKQNPPSLPAIDAPVESPAARGSGKITANFMFHDDTDQTSDIAWNLNIFSDSKNKKPSDATRIVGDFTAGLPKEEDNSSSDDDKANPPPYEGTLPPPYTSPEDKGKVKFEAAPKTPDVKGRTMSETKPTPDIKGKSKLEMRPKTPDVKRNEKARTTPNTKSKAETKPTPDKTKAAPDIKGKGKAKAEPLNMAMEMQRLLGERRARVKGKWGFENVSEDEMF